MAGTSWMPLQCPEPGNRDRRVRHTLVTLSGHRECSELGHRKEAMGEF